MDEIGCEGTGCTLAFAAAEGIPDYDRLPTVEIRFDRPFMFCARTDDGVPLFLGIVRHVERCALLEGEFSKTETPA